MQTTMRGLVFDKEKQMRIFKIKRIECRAWRHHYSCYLIPSLLISWDLVSIGGAWLLWSWYIAWVSNAFKAEDEDIKVLKATIPLFFDILTCEDKCTFCGSTIKEGAENLAIIKGPVRWICKVCYDER